MPETITPSDVSEFIRLKKSKAELSFKKEYLQNNGAGKDGNDATFSIDAELKAAESSLSGIEAKFRKADFSVVVPNEAEINGLTEKINAGGHGEIVEALKAKSGPLYSLLEKRGKLLLNNSEKRDEIGKLNILLHKTDKSTRKSVEGLLSGASDACTSSGKAGAKPDFFCDEKTKLKLARILKRLGIAVELPAGHAGAGPRGARFSFEETEINVDNRKVWVPSHSVEAVKENSAKIEGLLRKIQLKNAERQIKTFTEEEEKEFAKMQGEYLGLLKQKDSLLKEHYDECREAVVISK